MRVKKYLNPFVCTGNINFGDMSSIFKKGGLIPKFLKPFGKLKKINSLHGGIYTDETGAMYRKYNHIGGSGYRQIAKPGQDYIYTDFGGRHRISSNGAYSYISIGKGAGLFGTITSTAKQKELQNLGNLIRQRQDARRGTYYNKLLPDGRWYHDLGNGIIKAANSDGTNTVYYTGPNGKYIPGTGPKLLSNETTGNPQKPVNPKRNVRPTVNTNSTTVNVSPTNITDLNWLIARNNAMKRGWGSYIYNGQTYTFKDDELKNAKNNWKINRGKLRDKTGLLGIITSEPAETAQATQTSTTSPTVTLTVADETLNLTDSSKDFYLKLFLKIEPLIDFDKIRQISNDYTQKVL